MDEADLVVVEPDGLDVFQDPELVVDEPSQFVMGEIKRLQTARQVENGWQLLLSELLLEVRIGTRVVGKISGQHQRLDVDGQATSHLVEQFPIAQAWMSQLRLSYGGGGGDDDGG